MASLNASFPSLTPEQQRLLLNALTSSKAASPSATYRQQQSAAAAPSSGLPPTAFDKNASLYQEPTTLDSADSVDMKFPLDEYNFFDAEFGEKRKSPEDPEDDEEDGTDNKRRDSDDKAAKKPGRKPITTEPTTKRKAQNRAAQRAFRERKEKHLKDLETKVDELEKASAAANEENGLLRAQVQKLQSELKDYKKRISFTNASSPPRSSSLPFSASGNGLSDFNFEFHKFGDSRGSTASTSFSPGSSGASQRDQSQSLSPSDSLADQFNSAYAQGSGSQTGSGQWAGLFEINTNPYGFSPGRMAVNATPKHFFNGQDRSSAESRSSGSSAPSPSSSDSQKGNTNSSCTSPGIDEFPITIKPTTSNQSSEPALTWPHSGSVSEKTPGSDFNFDWLASQNGGQFDPVLFGDYRESQDAIIGDGTFSSGFFDDSLAFGDLNDPFMSAFTGEKQANQASPNTQQPAKTSLMEQVEKQKEGVEYDEPVKDNSRKEMWTAHKIWDTLQSCPKFQSGDFDLDGLCSELKAKARCSETGLAIPENDVKKALWKLAGPPQSGSDNGLPPSFSR